MAEFQLPALPYAVDALEPVIDSQTMKIHHDLHHGAYVTNLNAALKDHADLQSRSVEELIAGLAELPESVRTKVRNNGGGHLNHTLFWQLMTPGGAKAPSGALADAINGAFGSVDTLIQQVTDAGMTRFGSGWAWLTVSGGKLAVTSSANQDSPVTDGALPLIGVDVWEHAYYLKYQNRRAEYLKAWWGVLNWDVVAARFASAR